MEKGHLTYFKLQKLTEVGFFGKIDRYIIRQFLQTFFVAILLIVSISVVFDFSEKLDGFLGKYGPIPTASDIVWKYYANFIPYFGNLFSPLFVFISVIYFTSRMAARMEIIAILNSGWSYWRLLFPFLFSATVVASLSYALTNFVIPEANKERLEFESTYFRRGIIGSPNFHLQISPGEFIFTDMYNEHRKSAGRFCYERVDSNLTLKYKVISKEGFYDSLTGVWRFYLGVSRRWHDNGTLVTQEFENWDTILPVTPKMLQRDIKIVEALANKELNDFIDQQTLSGSIYLPFYLIEKHGRQANPISALILTFIAVPISSRKARGGIGFQLAIGVALAFAYIFLQKMTVSFALNGVIAPWLGVWLPNFFYIGIGFILAKFAQR